MSKEYRYTIFLISPKQKYLNYPAHTELAKIFGKRRLMVPLALPTVAALTPDHYRIRIIDEEIEELPRELPDIVGITTIAATSNRAWELGEMYRSRGVRVVFGGPYASFAVEACAPYCDSIVVGEAEGKWEACLSDFEHGRMKPVYESAEFTPYQTQKPPRWDLVNFKHIFQVGIQASRGCPFNCDFCLVSKMFGRKMRYRGIENIVDEIKASPSNYFFFVDDNLTINKKYAKELMKALIPLKISWGCMASIDVANDEELLQLMADAGCFNILIGFESLNPESLDETGKYQNKAAAIYEPAIRKIHAAGIQINASFVVGFDNDTLKEFDNIFDFTLRTCMPNVNLHLLSAPPGSETFRKMKGEGRLAGCPPEMGAGHFPTIHYMNMSQIELFERYMETIARLYSFDTIRKKAEGMFTSGNFTRSGGDIPNLLKAKLVLLVIREFLFTANADKRKLLFFLLPMIFKKRLAIDRGMAYMISMLGCNRHIRIHRKNMEGYRKMILRYDRGPWSELSRRIQEESR